MFNPLRQLWPQQPRRHQEHLQEELQLQDQVDQRQLLPLHSQREMEVIQYKVSKKIISYIFTSS